MGSANTVTFNNKRSKEFNKTIKSRVNAYFEENNLSKHANAAMVTKTVILLSFYLGAYAMIMSGTLGIYGMWIMAVMMGVGMAGIGFSISHDALHGAYSSNKTVNKILGYTFDMLGANGYIWKITHNIIHHTYTNIHEHDEDLDLGGLIRLSPHDKHRPIHRVQHVLAFVAYSLASLFWVLIKDYKHFTKRDMGPYQNKTHPTSEWVTLFVTKALYYTYTLVLPFLLLDVTFLQVLIGFTSLHLVAGIIMGVTFQLAHVVEETEHPEPDENNRIEEHWVIHEMRTTANFARNSKVLCWYMGGLNFQIEHHLFPQICSVHYPKISPIVERTAKEFGIPYHLNETFPKAVKSHYNTLKKHGDPNFVYTPA